MYLKKLLLQLNPHGQCLGYRPAPKQPYRFLTYTEVFQHARDFGSALITKVGLTPGTLNRIWIEQSNIPSIRLFFCKKVSFKLETCSYYFITPKCTEASYSTEKIGSQGRSLRTLADYFPQNFHFLAEINTN